jgi:hypothetical protein
VRTFYLLYDDHRRWLADQRRLAGRLGLWELPHPSISAFVGLDVLADVLPDLLAAIPPGLGDVFRGVFLLHPAKTVQLPTKPVDSSDVPAFVTVMHAGVAPTLLDPTLASFAHARDLLADAGASSYLADWLGDMTPDRWFVQFGPSIEGWHANRAEFDPQGVFCSRLVG